MNPAFITILALSPFAIFIFYQLYQRIGLEQKRERIKQMEYWAKNHPHCFNRNVDMKRTFKIE